MSDPPFPTLESVKTVVALFLSSRAQTHAAGERSVRFYKARRRRKTAFERSHMDNVSVELRSAIYEHLQ